MFFEKCRLKDNINGARIGSTVYPIVSTYRGKIIVIGAGIAGLAFIISLRKQWADSTPFPDIVLYERDSKETSIGREGYSISIRGDALAGGLHASDKMGILEEAIDASTTSSVPADERGTFRVWDLKLQIATFAGCTQYIRQVECH